MPEMTNANKDKLVSDLKVVVSDAEELLKITAGQVGEKAGALRERIKEHMEKAKVDLAKMQDMVVVKAKDAGRATDTDVHEKPWTAVGIAAGVGVLLGMLIARR